MVYCRKIGNVNGPWKHIWGIPSIVAYNSKPFDFSLKETLDKIFWNSTQAKS